MLVFLVGFMGAGKSTAGRMMASKTGFTFIDLDDVIELKQAKTISAIFKDDGPDRFRELETEALYELAGQKKTIVATGGGCPCVNNNMEWMNENGSTIYIRAHHGTLFHRLMPVKKNRPLIAQLSDVQLMEYILSQLPVRDKFYAAAKHIIDTGNEQPSVLSFRLTEVITKNPALPSPSADH